MARRRLPSCTYCDEPGLGNPPLCRRHFRAVHDPDPEDEEDVDIIDEIVERIVAHPDVRRWVGGMRGRIDDFVARNMDRERMYRGPFSGYQAEWPPRVGGSKEAPPQRPGPPRQATEDPRVVLGFPPGSSPARAEIKARQRALASVLHPDKGGSDAAMQRINAAAEALLSQLSR